jgi:hypothetical protein
MEKGVWLPTPGWGSVLDAACRKATQRGKRDDVDFILDIQVYFE